MQHPWGVAIRGSFEYEERQREQVFLNWSLAGGGKLQALECCVKNLRQKNSSFHICFRMLPTGFPYISVNNNSKDKMSPMFSLQNEANGFSFTLFTAYVKRCNFLLVRYLLAEKEALFCNIQKTFMNLPIQFLQQTQINYTFH